MITLTNTTNHISLELPETVFGIDYNRYNDTHIKEYYSPLISPFLVVSCKNPDRGIKNITLRKIRNGDKSLLKALFDLSMKNYSNDASITITHNDITYIGTVVGDITFTNAGQQTFDVSFQFIGKRV